DLWKSFAKPLLSARCVTLTADLDKNLRAGLKLDFAAEEQAKAGVQALKVGFKAARESLATESQKLEQQIRKGRPRFTSTFGQPAREKQKAPRSLGEERAGAAEDAFSFLMLGVYRTLDASLQALPREQKGKSVRLKASTAVNVSAWLVGISAV